jgi:hypothetical protein
MNLGHGLTDGVKLRRWNAGILRRPTIAIKPLYAG